jgi:TRAP-type C4-dicarboxylate transport system permease small subunit
VDRTVYQVERAVVAGSLLVMSGVVFADVVHRIFSYQESRLAGWIVAFVRLLGAGVDDRGALYQFLRDWVTPLILAGAFFGLVLFALRSSKPTRDLPWPKAMALAGAVLAGSWVVLKLYLWLVPNGVVWAQTLALVLTLWVGFFGASMCTYEGKHLRVEIADRIWPAKAQPYIKLFANFLTAAFVFLLLAVGILFIRDNYELWYQTRDVSGPFRAGMFEGLPLLPRWVAFLALPISFGVMGCRFVASGILAAMGQRYEQGEGGVQQIVADAEGPSPDGGGAAATETAPGASPDAADEAADPAAGEAGAEAAGEGQGEDPAVAAAKAAAAAITAPSPVTAASDEEAATSEADAAEGQASSGNGDEEGKS